jgi:hypothetical protein
VHKNKEREREGGFACGVRFGNDEIRNAGIKKNPKKIQHYPDWSNIWSLDNLNPNGTSSKKPIT